MHTVHDHDAQPGERPGIPGAIDQMRCAQNIPERVFEAARVAWFACPEPRDAEHIAERVASYYGYTDPAARSVFVRFVETHLLKQ